MFRRSSLTLAVAMLFAVASVAFAETEAVRDFLGLLDRVAKEHEPSIEANDDALVPLMESLRKSEGLEAALTLWKNKKRLPVELAWWRSPYRSTRMLAVALYYSEYPDRDVDFMPRFAESARRFDPAERDARLEEIEFIEKNLTTIRTKLNAILRKR